MKTVHVLIVVHEEWSSQGYLCAFLSPQSILLHRFLIDARFITSQMKVKNVTFSPKFIAYLLAHPPLNRQQSFRGHTLRLVCCILLITAKA